MYNLIFTHFDLLIQPPRLWRGHRETSYHKRCSPGSGPRLHYVPQVRFVFNLKLQLALPCRILWGSDPCVASYPVWWSTGFGASPRPPVCAPEHDGNTNENMIRRYSDIHTVILRPQKLNCRLKIAQRNGRRAKVWPSWFGSVLVIFLFPCLQTESGLLLLCFWTHRRIHSNEYC